MSSRESYKEVTDLLPTVDRPREEVMRKSGVPHHLDILKLATGRVVSL